MLRHSVCQLEKVSNLSFRKSILVYSTSGPGMVGDYVMKKLKWKHAHGELLSGPGT
jgi:hypothetical protein